MKIIQKPNPNTIKVLSRKALPCKYIEGNEYRLNKYVIKTETTNGTILLYNAFVKGCVEIDKDEDINQNYLFENYYVVDKDFNETELALLIIHTMEHDKMLHPMNYDNVHSYVILPTMNCNARCFYCYEKEYKKCDMTIETADKLVDFIAKHNIKKKRIHISWFGGEPLYKADIITHICNKLKEKNVEYESSMISNGYLFKDEVNIENASNLWGITNVQITIDGLEETYNKVKNYIYDDPNPFKTLISNIHKLLDKGIRIGIRMNLGYYNINEIDNLIEYLHEEFQDKKNFSMYVHKLFLDHPNGINNDKDFKEKNTETSKALLLLTEKIKQYKMISDKGKKDSNGVVPRHCMADNFECLVVNPEGNFTICEHFSDDHFIGNVDSDEINQEILPYFSKMNEPPSHCLDCPLVIFDCPRMPACDESQDCDEYYRAFHIIEKFQKIKNMVENPNINNSNNCCEKNCKDCRAFCEDCISFN